MGVLELLQGALSMEPARFEDMSAVMELRRRHEREFTGRVDVPVNARWIVVRDRVTVRACAAFAFGSNAREFIATDIYDDGTRQGKRALSMLLNEAGQARANGVRIYAIVPLDRPQLVRHLERRGLRVTGYSME